MDGYLLMSQDNPQVRSIATTGSKPHVIVRVKDQQLAISSAVVRQLLLMPEVFAVPTSPAHVRGVINVRGEVISLIDLRILLNIDSREQEVKALIQLLNEREQDHRNWLAELQSSVENRKAFALTRDPHQCKFGKWYDTFKPEIQSVAFLALWRSLNQPHQRIHAIADRVCTLTGQGRQAEAQAIIDATRESELKEMIRALDEVRKMIRETTREVALILSQGALVRAIAVDEVLAIESLDAATIKPLKDVLVDYQVEFTHYVARRPGSDRIVPLFDSDVLLQSDAAARAA
jgi:chemotaxis signal transduction protein